MALAVVRTSTLAGGNGVNRAACPTATSAAATAGNGKVAIVAAFRAAPSGNVVDSYDFVTPAGTVNVASPALRVSFVDGSYWRTELTIWVQPNAPAGITTGKPVLTVDDAANNVQHVFCEITDLDTTSPVDKTASGTNAGVSGTTTVSATTAALAQANEIVFAAFADRWNYDINGDSGTGAVPSGSGFTLLAGDAGNSILSFAAFYRIVSATTAISLTTAFADQADQGQVFGIVTLKGSTTNLRVEVTGFDPAVVAPGGSPLVMDDVGVWLGNVFTTLCSGHYEDVAFTTDGKLLLAPAPSGGVADQQVNVIVDDGTAGVAARGILLGTIKSYTP